MRPFYLISSFATLLACVIAQTGCDKIYNCNGGTRMDIRFELPVSIIPAKDTFMVGDTIWIENSFSNAVHDHVNNKAYKLDSFDFETTMVTTDLNTPWPAISYPDPRIIDHEGKTVGNDVQSPAYEALYVYYKNEGGMYKYKAAFIPDKAGFYLIDFFSYLDGNKVDITECANETLYMDYVTNNRGDNNYEMIKHSKDDKLSKMTKEDYDKEGCYCFYVK